MRGCAWGADLLALRIPTSGEPPIPHTSGAGSFARR